VYVRYKEEGKEGRERSETKGGGRREGKRLHSEVWSGKKESKL